MPTPGIDKITANTNFIEKINAEAERHKRMEAEMMARHPAFGNVVVHTDIKHEDTFDSRHEHSVANAVANTAKVVVANT